MFFVAFAAAAPVVFKPLDANLTDPKDFFFNISNPIPEEYVATPRFPIDPSPGPIQTAFLDPLFPPGKVARPTSSPWKNLWGFPWGDKTNWGAVYAYPYIIQPRLGFVTYMYPGPPQNFSENSRMLFREHLPLANQTPPIHNASIPFALTSAAFDFGLTIAGVANMSLDAVDALGARVGFQDAENETMCSLYLVKGSPVSTYLCNNASLAMWTDQFGVPPIIEINGKPPGSVVTDTHFRFKAAVGPSHPDGEWWHVWFDTPVSIALPNPPVVPARVMGLYSGRVAVGCGGRDDVAAPFLSDAVSKGYVAGGTIAYDITGDTGSISFNWALVPGGTVDPLGPWMLALPHHVALLNLSGGAAAASMEVTPVWSIRGNLTAVQGSVWTMPYNLSTKGFGETLAPPQDKLPAVVAALQLDAAIAMAACPGARGTAPLPQQNIELYAYARELAQVAELAQLAVAVGNTTLADQLTTFLWNCSQPLFSRATQAPQPCPPPINGTMTCFRNMTDLLYDTKWGGIVTTWYDQFANHYCQCDKPGGPGACVGLNYCDNVDGYDAFSNYGNAFYNDHHFQYGYLVSTLAWILHRPPAGFSPADAARASTLALMLARDYANPDGAADTAFPTLRHRDFFDGHSWAEGYSFSGRLNVWINQQSGGEAVGAYRAVYLLGLSLADANVKDWGRLNMAAEAQALSFYQLVSPGSPGELFPGAANVTRCVSILTGNGIDGATYFGPNPLFECGIVLLPLSHETPSFVSTAWANATADWLAAKVGGNGMCVFPDPASGANPCAGNMDAAWFGNAYSCCPVMSPPEAIPESGPPKCDIIYTTPPPDNVRTPQGTQRMRGAAHLAPSRHTLRGGARAKAGGVQVHACNQWRAFPDWLPVLYYLASFATPADAWDMLTAMQEYTPNPPMAPFPYIRKGTGGAPDAVVGYAPALSRALTMYHASLMATTPRR